MAQENLGIEWLGELVICSGFFLIYLVIEINRDNYDDDNEDHEDEDDGGDDAHQGGGGGRPGAAPLQRHPTCAQKPFSEQVLETFSSPSCHQRLHYHHSKDTKEVQVLETSSPLHNAPAVN